MYLIIVILCIIICMLITYLFFIKKELKRITKEIEQIQKQDSNASLHTELSMKEEVALINEINTLISALRKKQIEFDKENEFLRKMLTNISHDLRTPLTSALGYVHILQTTELSNEEKKKELQIVSDRLKRVEEFIDSFFEFSKIITNENQVPVEPVNLISVLENKIAHYYEDFVKENRTIILETSLTHCEIQSNIEMLTRIFENLIGNALKHSYGDLEIHLEEKEDVRISFINPLEFPGLDIEHIFDEFYTVDISRTKGNTGLGLAIAKEFTSQLNGTITALKKDGKLEIRLQFKK